AEDSNWLTQQAVNATAVAIRKPLKRQRLPPFGAGVCSRSRQSVYAISLRKRSKVLRRCAEKRTNTNEKRRRRAAGGCHG
ncbi:hypothetical protein, partial [uncultured Desulfovibrio sp.]|uniref:hypothetical protein n=1 Tax=uncultured Desulfovibrio sp. TaxID=167968 RepID=UPI00263A1C74